ncbi:hypothetical protein NBZ79_00545 [Sneathiella marina]|uniref:Uncharacterized protein n=1 Tax=Sneathiella marina TaxID=2950108 RepID=A0ABY4W5S5_9PROT|nr:hypothetical protein [Sneathiella marina]USG61463.1 hypothetical protein NBZ79_00545 [Sneathiella marina]
MTDTKFKQPVIAAKTSFPPLPLISVLRTWYYYRPDWDTRSGKECFYAETDIVLDENIDVPGYRPHAICHDV